MADETVKKLLIKLGISTADWKVAVNEIKTQLNAVNEQAKKDAAQMKAVQKEQINLTKQQITDQQRLTAEAKTLAAVDQAKAQWQKQQQEAIKTAVQQRILETAEAKKQAVIQQASIKMAQEQLRLEQQRFRLIQQQQNLQAKQARAQESRGGGGLLGGLGGFASRLAGGGTLGMVAGGAAVGEIISEGAVKLLEMASERLRSLTDALLEAAGPAAQLREQFEKLTARAGIDPEEYLNKLRAATRGLADDVSLYRIANNYMQQGLKVSNDEIVRLVKATVDLARAQGKTAPEAMSALERASKTGRTQILAMVTGLTRQELAVRGLSQALDPVTRNTMQFNQVLAALEAREKAIGTPTATLPELFSQWSIVQKNLVDDMAAGMTHTVGYQKAIQALSDVITKIQPILSELAVLIGEKIGDALYAIEPAIRLIKSSIQLGEAVLGPWIRLAYVLMNVKDATDDLGTGATGFHKYITQLAFGFTTIAQYVTEASIKITAFGQIASAVLKGNAAEAGRVYAQMNKDINDSREKYGTDVMDILSFGAGTGKKEPKKAGKQQDVNYNPVGARQRQQLELQIAKETSEIRYQMLMEGLKKEEDAVKAAYDSGLISLQEEIEKERVIYAAEHKAKLQEITEERDEKIANIRANAAAQYIPADIVKKQINVATLAAQQKTESENTSYQQKGAGLDTKLRDDKLNAYRTMQDELAKIAREGVQDRLKVLESEFKEGLVGADDYINKRKALIQEELSATLKGLDIKLAAAKQNESETAKLSVEGMEARRRAQQQLNELEVHQDEIRLQASETRYRLQTAPLQTTVKLAQGDITGRSVGVEDRAQQQLLLAAHAHLQDLLAQTPKAGSDAWQKQQEEIAKTRVEIQSLTQELIKLHNISVPLGGIFGSISSLLGAIPNSRGAAGAAELFGNMQQTSATMSPFFQQNAAIKAAQVPEMKSIDIGGGQISAPTGNMTGPGNIFSALGTSFKDLFKNTDSLSDRFKSFGNNLGGIASGLQGMIQGTTKSKSAGGGALSGGMAGMQMGQAAGPWGMVIGGAAGAIMGGIFGAKNAQLQQTLHKIQTQMQSIVADMNSGTISMSQAIEDMRQERKAAIEMLSKDPKASKGAGGAKGGKKGYNANQAQAEIEAIDQQISQLINQQAQVLESLTTSLMELSNPLQYQDYLQSLDQIIQKYQQFASAAQGNAQMMGEANQYLNDSLNNYVETLSNQLNQAQQSAIQDALTLINLEYQRQQIINQEAQQEYDVLTQGVLTRQRTTAMTKGQEIGQLRYQRDMQLEQINEQISLEQYKVAQETQIFNLATTRIGLETQLLEAQEQAQNYQILQVQALAQVVGDLQSGLSGGQLTTAITNLMGQGALPTESGIMLTLLQMLGLGGNVPTGIEGGQYGTTNWLAGIPSTDAGAAQYMNAMDPNFGTYILNKQWASALADMTPYMQQGEVEGYNMVGLQQWLQAQGANAPPGAAEGGDVSGLVTVGESGPELLSMGGQTGTVIPNPIVTALNAMISGVSGGKTGPSSNLLSVHKQLYDITSQRTSMEMTVISARTSQLQMEMQYLQALQDFNASNSGGSQTGIEDMLAKVYENRGRYGSGNFRREVL